MAFSRTWLLRLGLLVGGLTAGVVLAEGLARVIAPEGAELLFAAGDASPPGLYQAHSTLGHVPTPGFEGSIRSLGYSVDLRIDEHGLRGGGPAPDGERWLAIGDSFTISVQVPEEQTFVGLLDASSGREVLNAGADAYSTWQALGRYRELAPVLETDAVLLTFFLGNDWTDNLSVGGPGMGFQEPPERDPLHAFLSAHSYLYGQWQVMKRRAELQTVAVGDLAKWSQELSLFHVDGAATLASLGSRTEPALAELAKVAAANGDRLLVAIAPPSFVVESERAAGTLEMVGLDPAGADLDAPRETVLELLHRAGLDACDLSGPLAEAHAEGVDTYLTYDGHWTAEGHEVVAAALERCMAAPAGSLVPASTGADIRSGPLPGGHGPGPGAPPPPGPGVHGPGPMQPPPGPP